MMELGYNAIASFSYWAKLSEVPMTLRIPDFNHSVDMSSNIT